MSILYHHLPTFFNWKEVAEPLLDLKEGIDQLENNKTLGFILSTLLAIGNFLNGTNVSLLYSLFSYLPCHKVPAFHLLREVVPLVLQSTDEQVNFCIAGKSRRNFVLNLSGPIYLSLYLVVQIGKLRKKKLLLSKWHRREFLLSSSPIFFPNLLLECLYLYTL